MRILLHPTMTRKMFTHGCHAGLMNSQHPGVSQLCNNGGFGMEGAVTNDFAVISAQIQHWGKAEINPDRSQFSSH